VHFYPLLSFVERLTVCVTRWWAGVDSVWEQKKTQSQPVLVIAQGKMLVNRAREAPQRPVHIILVLVQDALLGAILARNINLIST